MKLDDKLNTKYLSGGVIVVGLAVIGSYFMLKNYVDRSIQQAYNVNQFGVVNDANGPATPVSAAFMNPPATHAAPRMYVNSGPGSNGMDNPGESWLQGGGASVTSSSGKWADDPNSDPRSQFGGGFIPSGYNFNPQMVGGGYGGA